jgi:hypothetical protein
MREWEGRGWVVVIGELARELAALEQPGPQDLRAEDVLGRLGARLGSCNRGPNALATAPPAQMLLSKQYLRVYANDAAAGLYAAPAESGRDSAAR